MSELKLAQVRQFMKRSLFIEREPGRFYWGFGVWSAFQSM
jgi:hypothetical protein